MLCYAMLYYAMPCNAILLYIYIYISLSLYIYIYIYTKGAKPGSGREGPEGQACSAGATKKGG